MGAVAASVAGSVVSSALSSKASGDASKASSKAAAISQVQLDQARKENKTAFSPYQQNGPAASQKLSYLLGLTPLNNGSVVNGVNTTYQPKAPVVDQGAKGGRDFLYQAAKQRNQLEAYYKMLSDGSLDASNATSKSSKLIAMANAQQSLNDENQSQLQASQSPLDTSDGKYGSLLNNFSQNDLNNDVVYNTGLGFGLDEGTKAIDRLSASNGSLDSGSTLKALTRYANDYGTTKASGAFDRFNTNKLNTYNMLSSQQGVGLNATGQNQSLNTSLLTGGANIAQQNGVNQANAGSAGASGINNAIQGGIGNYLYSQRTQPQNASVVGANANIYGGTSMATGQKAWYA